MIDTTGKTKVKRLSKSQRTHIRRLKQAARKAGTSYTASRPSAAQPIRIPKESRQNNLVNFFCRLAGFDNSNRHGSRLVLS